MGCFSVGSVFVDSDREMWNVERKREEGQKDGDNGQVYFSSRTRIRTISTRHCTALHYTHLLSKHELSFAVCLLISSSSGRQKASCLQTPSKRIDMSVFWLNDAHCGRGVMFFSLLRFLYALHLFSSSLRFLSPFLQTDTSGHKPSLLATDS